MGLRVSDDWGKSRAGKRGQLFRLMEQEFGDIYFPPPYVLPEVINKHFQYLKAKSDVMTREEIKESLSTVPPGNSVFIVKCGHESLSASLDSWKALA